MNASGIDAPASPAPAGGRGRWHLIATIPKVVIALLLILAMVNLLVGVFLRYVVVGVTDYFDWPTVSFFWVEEVGEFALAWLSLVGAAVAISERTHFSLDVLVHRFSPATQVNIERFNALLIAGFGALVMVFGWGLAAINGVLTSPGLEINLGWLYASSGVGGAMIVVYALVMAVRAGRGDAAQAGGH